MALACMRKVMPYSLASFGPGVTYTIVLEEEMFSRRSYKQPYSKYLYSSPSLATLALNAPRVGYPGGNGHSYNGSNCRLRSVRINWSVHREIVGALLSGGA